MLVYLNVYNQDRLLDTPTDIVVNRLCKIWRELVIAGKNDEDKVDLVEAPSIDEEESPAKSTSSVLNFFMGKTVYSAANPLRIAFIHEFPCATSSWDSLHEQGRQYLDEHFGGIVRTEAFRGLSRSGRVLRRRRDSRKARGERHLLDLTPAHGIHAQGVSRVSPGAVP